MTLRLEVYSCGNPEQELHVSHIRYDFVYSDSGEGRLLSFGEVCVSTETDAQEKLATVLVRMDMPDGSVIVRTHNGCVIAQHASLYILAEKYADSLDFP